MFTNVHGHETFSPASERSIAASISALVFNPTTGEVLWEENSRAPRSIASITKVMTALVFLEDNPDLTYGFIKEALLATAEINAGKATKYVRRTKPAN